MYCNKNHLSYQTAWKERKEREREKERRIVIGTIQRWFSIEMKEEDLISSPFPHPYRRLITFSLFLWNLIIKEKEKVMFIVFSKVQNFFLSTAIIEMKLYFTFLSLPLSLPVECHHIQASIEISSAVLITIHESFKLCWFYSFFSPSSDCITRFLSYTNISHRHP
jgi:hypothetical protein